MRPGTWQQAMLLQSSHLCPWLCCILCMLAQCWPPARADKEHYRVQLPSHMNDQGMTARHMQMPPPKPRPRQKLPMEKGYSQMDWMRLAKAQPRLGGTLLLRHVPV